ncbi:MAG: hypothetical protein IJM62_01230 [Lachnospiraceae bacterium]|nr:hypothetical protein [Lachnospiraceae bacterium]
MRLFRIKKYIAALAALMVIIGTMAGCSSREKDEKLSVKVLLLPKFEVGDITGDFPGEAQYFYDEYLAGGEEYEIDGCPGRIKVYYKDGVAMCLAGQGKVAAALNTSAVLSDDRFDFSDAYILAVGCGGSSEGYGICGDVFVISEAADFDLGHHADAREMENKSGTTWFHDESYDATAVVRLDTDLTDRVYERVKDVPLATTENTESFLKKQYPGEAWADRKPQVMRGTSVTSDNFWKGEYDHRNAVLITETYGCRDPYAVTEMEDIAVGHAVKRAGKLDRLIILRVSVNMDVFPEGVTPEMLWGPETDDHIASDDSQESVDIFETAMKNCFDAGKVIIDAILEGTL